MQQRRPYTGVEYTPGEGINFSEMVEKGEMPREFVEMREKLLMLPSRTEGLDTARIQSFLAERNLPQKDYLVYFDEDLPAIRTIIGHPLYGSDSSVEGEYILALDFVLLKRNTSLELQNGSETTEGFLIHELAHAVRPQKVEYTEKPRSKLFDLRKQNVLVVPESGFLENLDQQKSHGHFIEEGFADMMRGEYMNGVMPHALKKFLAKRFQEFSIVRLRILNEGQFVKYAFKENDDFAIMPSSYAALGLELLCRKEPKLREALLRARSDVSVLEDIPKLVNGLRPGLYERLRELDRTYDDFQKGLVIIAKELYAEDIRNTAKEIQNSATEEIS